MKTFQKTLLGVTYVLVPQLEVLKECEGCAFRKRGDLCCDIGEDCTTEENKGMVWEMKKENL